MSRHRNFQKMDYAEEMYDDDDYFGRSYDEDPVAMSPSASQFMYHRNRLSSTNTTGTRLAEFIPEEANCANIPNDAVGDEDGAVFSMDDVEEPNPPETSSQLYNGPPPGLGFDAPVVFDAGNNSSHKPSTVKQKEEKPHFPLISNLRVSEPTRSSSKSPSRKKEKLDNRITPQPTPATLTSNSSSHRLSQLAAISSAPSTPRRSRPPPKSDKQLINLVVVGHVDAGKSTLMGHLLCQLGCVDQRVMHKYKQESARSGKASFAFAWVLDETEEERSRGVTMDIAKTFFETKSKRVLLLDAPGHKDFIPNMITGASQADAAILVVNSTRGEFETGFESGGQTKEHAMLLRSLGVSQLVVAVNKLDTHDWSEERFVEVKGLLNTFLTKTAGFSNVHYVPVSGLGGENLSERVPEKHPLHQWYTGKTLIDYIDDFSAPPRPSDGPLRIVVNDIFKATTSQLSLSGKIESGDLVSGQKVFIMPNADAAVVKACSNDDGGSADSCIAGDQILITLNGVFEPDTINCGHVIVSGGEDTLIPGSRFSARIVIFDISVPLMKGTKAELYCHSLCVPCTIVKLVSSIHKSSGNVLKERPRCLSRHMSGIVHIETDFDVAIEPYTVCKALGRITLRASGQTIAAGIIESKLS